MARPIYQRVAVTDAGDVIPGAEYTVTNENTGTEQTIYDARSGGAVISQPAFADANGVIQFWTEPGVTYRVEATGGVGTYTDRYVEADTRMTDLSDPASGSLMPPGAFGLGAAGLKFTGDLNTLKSSGWCFFDSGSTNTPDSNAAILRVDAGSISTSDSSEPNRRISQTAINYSGSAAGSVWLRTFDGSVWSAWQRIDPQAFGLGARSVAPDSTDADTLFSATGFYYSGSWTNTPVSYGYLQIVAAPNNGYAKQVFTVTALSTGSANEVYERSRYGGGGAGWTAWRRTYDTGNLLGTVSQSGGVPTGAVIERGSNANGEYVKFADGTMIMTANVTASLTSGSVQTFPFPAAIVDGADSPFLSFGMGGNASERTQYRLTDGFLTTSLDDSWSVQLTSTGGATGGCTLRLLAVGRWF